VDFALREDFKLTERFKTIFRVEMFDALNQASFRLPDAVTLTAAGTAKCAAGLIT
jgi:hypothetical protein